MLLCGTTDEFIELYNPTSTDVSLNGWQLIKKTSAGSNYILVDNFGDTVVRAHSFFLVAHPTGYLSTVVPDQFYTTTNSISDNNTIVLSDSTQAVVDEVGYGTVTVFETEATANPAAGKSLERKARADSLAELMAEGGAHYFLGNGEDSDNNKNDFVTRETPEPQNSTNEPEYSELAPPVNQPAPDVPPSPIYSKNIGINELFPNPKGVDDGEFIELYNTGNEPVDLNGWKISDATARTFIITPEDYKSTVIAAQGYFVIDKKVSAISLNNTFDAAKLYHPDDTVVSSVEYSGCLEAKSYSFIDGTWVWTDNVTPGQSNTFLSKNELPIASFGTDGKTMKVGAKIFFDASDSSDPDDDTLMYAWSFGDGATASGVKTDHAYQKASTFTVRLMVSDGNGGEAEAEQVLEISDYDYSSKLIINELLPACQGTDEDCEYIELYNHENRSVKLDGWRLIIRKAKYIFTEKIVIKPHGFLLVKRSDSRLSLNNTGGTIFLADPRGKIINGVKYSKAKDDLSFSRVDTNEWQWTATQTPGKQNEFDSEEEVSKTVDIVISDQATNGTGKKQPMDSSSTITPISGATEDKIGDTLKISAEVESTSGSNIYLVDEAGNSLRAYIQKTTGIKKPGLKSGDQVEIVGVLDKTTTGLRLLPRKQEDIVVLAQPIGGQVLGTSTEKSVVSVPVKNRDKQVRMYLIGGVAVSILALFVFLFRKNRSTTEN